MAITIKHFKKIFLTIYVSGLLLLPFVLILLPANYFDDGKSMCLSVVLFDQTCYGCGMTKAIQHILHFDFAVAYDFNRLFFIVLPILVVLWFIEVRRLFKKIKTSP